MGTPPLSTAGAGSVTPAVTQRGENLALLYQEILTAIVRLRFNRQVVTDAGAFRAQIRTAIESAQSEAVRRGYSPEDSRMAAFAVVAFLDESILNSSNAAFSDWPRMPLQEELFGTHLAGEMFYQVVERLLSRRDSVDVADLLEVYALCLMLGFRGRYSMSGPEALRPMIEAMMEKIHRVRGTSYILSPAWAPPAESVQTRASDPWVLRLLFGVAATFVLALALFVAFTVSLGSGASELHSITSQAIH
ncbi:MAG TPA: DotU family type IV/VI secretion system protein [Terriglobia bacterium]|jgi:type VI secretion system protein ImpK|nr:DotU family type IV/VI secretion system protein [Terriglobia bacterium]